MKVGVIGLGEVSQLMHLPILSDMYQDYQITAVSDVAPSLVEHIAKKYGVAQSYLDYTQLIDKADIDAVFVLSPDQYHGDAIKRALNAGKHVFCEKPAALYAGELEELLPLAAAHPQQVVMVGYMRRYAAPFLKAKALLAADDRPVKYLRFRDIICEAPFYVSQTRKPFYPTDVMESAITEGRARRDQHLDAALGADATEADRITYMMLTGLGCHSFSAVRELFGAPKKIHSVTTASGGEHIVVVMEFDGFLATYELVNNTDIVQFDAAVEILQQDRKLLVKHETPYLRYQPCHLEVTETVDGETRTTTYGPDYRDPFRIELELFAECVREKKQPKTTLADAVEDLKLFEGLMRVKKEQEARG